MQTFGYDALNRMTGFTWSDGGLTPSVTFGYDKASRLVEIDNANASISRSYYNDNLLHMETQNLSGSSGLDNRQVTYTYDKDGNRSSLTMPGYTFDYVYTHRNQVKQINDDATGLSQAYYEYNTSGNVTLRNVYTTPITVSNYSYDPSDRITSVTHTLNGTTRTHSYGYYDNSYNRKYAKRGISPNSPESNKGEVFDYDLADQAIVAKLNIVNPDTASPGNQTIFHDANGNRTTFSAYGVTDTYTTNNLNQYSKRNSKNASYYPGGTMSGSPDSGASQLTCTYDAQNRLRTAGKNSTSMSFKYDGLNRQVSRTVNGVTTYSTWDGWNLVEEYTNNPLAIQARYLYGPTGLVKDLQNNRYYCQDGSGSTSHLLDSTGHLLEWYRYDLQGTPFFYDPTNDTPRSPNQSAFNVRHLFTGQQWYKDVGLYDLRNRFYSPDLGRFLQPDPIGFRGDRTNLYRYCGNNPVTGWDPFGLQGFNQSDGNGGGGGGTVTLDPVRVSEVPLPYIPNGPEIPFFLQRPLEDIMPSPFDGLPPSGGGHAGGNLGSKGGSVRRQSSPSSDNSTNPQDPPQQNPPTPSPGTNNDESWGQKLSNWVRSLEEWYSNNIFRGPFDNAVFNSAGTVPAGPRQITFRTSHAASHLDGTGLQSADVEAAISQSIQSQRGAFAPNSPFMGRVTVNGQTIEYRGFTLSNGEVNVGTYYPPGP